MSLDDFKANMPLEIWKTLKHIRFCGTYGDPLMHKNLLGFIEYIKEQSSNVAITINTNGGIRSTKWWSGLAKVLGPNDLVFFGIDGLEDTNHLHRIDVDFTKVINNLTAFNRAGGRSVWSYIVFEHNEHQVEDARKLSEKLGCLRFKVKSTSRFVDKTHTPIDQAPVMNMEHNIIRWIKPAKGKYRNTGYDDVNNVIKQYGTWEIYLEQADIDCASKKFGETYIAADGEVFPCGFLADRMYGYESENHRDNQVMKGMMEKLGGQHKINFLKTPLREIVEQGWFPSIEQSWTTNQIHRCANQCGTQSNLIQQANKDLLEIWNG
jgi:MoaA/NifB/PqqE/SkfB family radical SAM enzyme